MEELLQSQISKKNKLLEQIKEKQDILTGIPDRILTGKIDIARKERETLISQLKEKQYSISVYDTDPKKLQKEYDELTSFCNKLTVNENLLRELNSELNLKNRIALSKLPAEYQLEIDELLRKVSEIDEKISGIREKLRLDELENLKNIKFKGLDFGNNSGNLFDTQKVWIDENLGVYINYPMNAVIAQTMNCIFSSGLQTIPSDFPSDLKSERLNNLFNLDTPGLPSLLKTFIETILKAVGQGFAKQFFFFKNTIDLIAGLELGELLGNMVPGLPKILKDLKLLFTDASKWMYSKMLSPLFDINIPIPSFELDIGSMIPLLPFTLKIPKIDPYGYFNKLTPFNINIDPSLVASDWQAQITNFVKSQEKEFEEKFKNIKLKKLSNLRDKIQKLTDDINLVNKFVALEEKLSNSVDQLINKGEELKNKIEQNINLGADYLLDLENQLKQNCEKLTEKKKQLEETIQFKLNEQLRLDSLNVDDLKNELSGLQSDLTNLVDDNKPNVSFKNFAKRSLLIAFDANVPQDGLTDTISNLWDIGVNVFDNQVTEFLQKIGYDFSNEKYIDRIRELRDKYGFTFNDATLLFKLYQLGFSLNDPDYLTKLGFLQQHGIDIRNTDLLLILQELGFNFNNSNFYDIIIAIHNDLGINPNDIDILKRLNSIGFNFNNVYAVERLRILGQYVDIKTVSGYDNALSKNINLNNPYIEQVLKKYSWLNLNWNGGNFLETEAEILSTITVEQVDRMKGILQYFDNPINNTLNLYFNKTSVNIDEFVKYIYTFGIDGVRDNGIVSIMNILNDGGTSIFKIDDSPQLYEYREEYDTTNPRWYENITLKDSSQIRVLHDNGLVYKETLFTGYTNIINDDGSGGTYDSVIFTAITYCDKLYCVPLSSTPIMSIINQWNKYNIKLDLNSPTLPYVGASKFIGINKNVERVTMMQGTKEIYFMLDLMRDFVLNQGWVIDGIRVADNFSTLQQDYENMVAGSGLQLVTGATPANQQITYDQLSGIYGNFDKLGLNVRDPNYNTKFRQMLDILKIKVDEINIFDTKRKVTLTWYERGDSGAYDVLNQIDLAVSKPDPKVFDDDRYNARIEITNIIDPNVQKQPTKTIIQFDSINKMGFNFQNPNYFTLLNKLSGLEFNISAFETVDIVDSLCALGWHYNCKNAVQKLDYLIQFGFSFKIPPTNTQNDDLNYDVDMDKKLITLICMGFNFNKENWQSMLTDLMSIGLNIADNDFENAINQLIGFGINLNDIDCTTKLSKLKDMGINFASVGTNGVKNWIAQLSNLSTMGIDFIDDNWLELYNKAVNFKKLGIDFLDVLNKKKLAVLTKIGLNFNAPDFMEKMEGLVQLKLVSIPENIVEQKLQYLKDKAEKLSKIMPRINYLQNIVTGQAIVDIDIQIKKLRLKFNALIIELEALKKISITNLDAIQLNNLSELMNTKCSEIQKTNDEINKLLEERKKLTQVAIQDLQSELSQLLQQKLELELNKAFQFNTDFSLNDLSKFIALEKLGFNFYDPNWMKNIQLLLKQPFDFSMPDWQDLLPGLMDLLPRNPILDWGKSMVDTIISTITMPLKSVFEFIKKLIDLIVQVIAIPLNPTKIPEWAMGIIKKFNDLVNLIKKLPTLEGMLDFLFLSPAGLALIDIYVKGFSEFMTKIKNLTTELNNRVQNYRQQYTQLKEKYQTMLEEKLKRITEINVELEIVDSLLNGNYDDIIAKLNDKFNKVTAVFTDNITKLKELAQDAQNTSQEVLDILEKQLTENCEKITLLRDKIFGKNDLLDSLKSKTKQELEEHKDIILSKLSNINGIYDTDSMLMKIGQYQSQITDLVDKISLFADIFKWKDNMDKIIEELKKYIDEKKGLLNPYTEQFDTLVGNISKLKDQLGKIETNGFNVDVTELKNKLGNLTKLFNANNIKITNLEKYLCENKSILSDEDFSIKMIELDDLSKVKEELQKQMDNANKLINNASDYLSDAKDKIINQLNQLETQKAKLQSLIDGFNRVKETGIKELENVIKWIPTILNLISCLPKVIVNIFVGLLNAIGSMKNLPTLWNFSLI